MAEFIMNAQNRMCPKTTYCRQHRTEIVPEWMFLVFDFKHFFTTKAITKAMYCHRVSLNLFFFDPNSLHRRIMLLLYSYMQVIIGHYDQINNISWRVLKKKKKKTNKKKQWLLHTRKFHQASVYQNKDCVTSQTSKLKFGRWESNVQSYNVH